MNKLSKARIWTGWIISALPALLLFSGAINAFRGASFVLEGTRHLGYPDSAVTTIGVLELVCSVLYMIPQTSAVGAVLLTGYFGGATASHVRVGEAPYAAIIAGVVVWLGLFLRDARLQAFFAKEKL